MLTLPRSLQVIRFNVEKGSEQFRRLSGESQGNTTPDSSGFSIEK